MCDFQDVHYSETQFYEKLQPVIPFLMEVITFEELSFPHELFDLREAPAGQVDVCEVLNTIEIMLCMGGYDAYKSFMEHTQKQIVVSSLARRL